MTVQCTRESMKLVGDRYYISNLACGHTREINYTTLVIRCTYSHAYNNKFKPSHVMHKFTGNLFNLSLCGV